jgi:hypothetical protein
MNGIIQYVLAFMLIGGGCALLYMLQEKTYSKEVVPVAWTSLFTNYAESAKQKKLWKWILYILQCLLLILVVFLLLKIQLPKSGDTLIIVLDRTHSMFSTSENSTKNRFETAQGKIKEELSRLSGDNIELYTFGGTAKRISYPDTLSAISAIDSMSPGNISGDLTDALDLLQSDINKINAEKILIFTDHLSSLHKTELGKFDVPVESHISGGGTNNLYIEYLRIISGFIDLNPENIIISYQFSNSSGTNRFRYEIHLFEMDGRRRTYKWTNNDETLTLKVGNKYTKSITLGQLMQNWGITSLAHNAYIYIKLIPVDNKNNKDKDDLPNDNIAWGMLPDTNPIKLGVFDKKLFTKLYGEFDIKPELSNQIRKIKIIDLSTQDKEGAEYHNIAILNQTPPLKGESLEHLSSIYSIAHPSIDNIKFPDEKIIQAVKGAFIDDSSKTIRYSDCRVISWRRDDELTNYLDNFSISSLSTSIYPFNWLSVFSSFSSPMLKEIRYSPIWLKPLIVGRFTNVQPEIFRLMQVPIVMKGTFENRRTVVFNFDISEYDMKVYKDLKILLLNSIKWLYTNARMSSSVVPGKPFHILWDTKRAPFYINGPGYNMQRIEDNMTPSLDNCGIYTIFDKQKEISHSFAIGPFENSKEYNLRKLSLANSTWNNDRYQKTSSNYEINNEWDSSIYPRILLWLMLIVLFAEFVLYMIFFRQRLYKIMGIRK